MTVRFRQQRFWPAIKNTFLVVVGTALLAFGTGIFIIPFDLVTGGVSGLGIIFDKLFSGVSFLDVITADVYASFLNWVLFFVGLAFLGRGFAMKTLVSTIVYPLALSLAVSLSNSGVLGGFFNLLSDKYASYGEISVILACVFGGAAVGAGCALTFLGGGSTGGVDIIALAICKRFKSQKSSVVMFAIDTAIVVLGMLLIKNLVISLLGIVSALICAITIDRLFIGESGALIAQVISDRHEDINRFVIERMGRTTTIIDAKGGYTGTDKKMIMVTFPMNRYAEFIALVEGVDRSAFITVHRAHEINGEGWTYELPRSDSTNKMIK